MNSVNDRLELLMKHFDLTVNSLAKKLNFSRTAIHNIVSENGRRTSPSHDFYVKLKESYENINLNWLVTGEGEMLIGSQLPLAEDAMAIYKNIKSENTDLYLALNSLQQELHSLKERVERLEQKD